MKRPLVTFFTLAYNAEDYIAQTIESVLNQSEPNIEYIISNNGSTDKTGEICKTYANKDKRIKLIHNKLNHHSDDGKPLLFWEHFKNPKGEFVSYLDSDDFIHKDYVKHMYEAGKKQNADIVICGTRMFRDGNEAQYGDRIPPDIVISENNDINSDDFIALYGSLRPLWAKLYKTEFYEKYIYQISQDTKHMVSGGDTATVLLFLKHAHISRSIDKALHYYRIKDNSTYNQAVPDIKRIEEGDVLYKRAWDVANHFKIKQDNISEFLINVHYSHMMDLLNLCVKSTQMKTQEKLFFLESILKNDILNKCAFNDDNISKTFEDVMSNIEKIKFNTTSDRYSLQNSFLGRLLMATSTSIQICYPIRLILLLSAVMDEKNSYFFGKYLLEKIDNAPKWFIAFHEYSLSTMKFISENKIAFREVINSYASYKDFSKIKNDILDAIDNGNLVDAKSLLDKIFYCRPLDREAVYLKIYIIYLEKDFTNMLITSELAELFWNDDDEIMALIDKIWNN